VRLGTRQYSPLRYLGGKSAMVKNLLPLLPPHDCYVEVFGGGASVLFAKQPAAVEVYNDLDEHVVNFFRVLRDPKLSLELQRVLRLTPYSRVEYYEALECLKRGDFESSIERAAMLFIINRQSFAGIMQRPCWGYSSKGCGAPGVWRNVVDNLHLFAERLRTVFIDCRDFREVIPAWDSRETLFYCDPPYIVETRKDKSPDYRVEMTLRDHIDLHHLLLCCQGMVVLSGYRHAAHTVLEAAGWKRWDFEAVVHSQAVTGERRHTGTQRPRVIESVWLNPAAQERRGIQQELKL